MIMGAPANTQTKIEEIIARSTDLCRKGAFVTAEALVSDAMGKQSSSITLKDQLAQIYRTAGKYADAISIYKEILGSHPDSTEAGFHLAEILNESGYPDQAKKWYHFLTLQAPRLWQAWFNLGNIHREEQDWDSAIRCYQNVIKLHPQMIQAYDYIGRAYRDADKLESGEKLLSQGLEINAEHPSLYNTLGQVYYKLGRYNEALECYDRAIRLNPDFKEAKFSRSLVLLKTGNFKDGLRDYEYRFALRENVTRKYGAKEWTGEDITGKVLLVHWEQGLGDTILFIRYIPKLSRFNCEVCFECQKPLIPLLKGFAGVNTLIPAGDHLPHYDAHISLMSLPKIFNTDFSTIPADVPYLKAPVHLIRKWQKLISAPACLKIGIVWQGSLEAPSGRVRSFSRKEFNCLSSIPDIRLYSLQRSEEKRAAESHEHIREFAGDFDQSEGAFMDTSAVMNSLDLVITCDTSIAHLAGALGRRVWVLLPFSADWRWFLNREDSPWYPTMRLFRQTKPGDWRSVSLNVRSELKKIQHGKDICV